MPDASLSAAAVDEWAQIAVDSIREGAEVDVEDDLGALLLIEMGFDNGNAHANGPLFTVEISFQSSGDEDWAELCSWRGPPSTADTCNVDQQSAAGTTTLYVDATANFTTLNDLYFVKDATIANSEIVRNNGYAVNDYITVLDGLTNTHENTADVFNVAQKWTVWVPPEAMRSRVLVWNDDADCTICTKTRVVHLDAIE